MLLISAVLCGLLTDVQTEAGVLPCSPCPRSGSQELG